MLCERPARVWLALNLASVVLLSAAACGSPGSPTSPPLWRS
jgi:hypothetical protein